MATVVVQSSGLKWISAVCALLGIKPRWSIVPDIERIREVVKAVLPSEQEQDVSVTFFAEGSFNKLYSIRYGNEEAILRVALPVEPHWKTLSEIATLKWISRNTSLPVPKILAYDASRDNRIEFEWILMSKLPGKPLSDVWRSIDFEAKKAITRHWALFAATTFKKQLRGTGNVFPLSESADADGGDLHPEVKRIVSMQFFWGNRISRPIPRGPFHSSKDWLLARLLLIEGDCHETVARLKAKYKLDKLDKLDELDELELEKLAADVKVANNLHDADNSEEDADDDPDDADELLALDQACRTLDVIERLQLLIHDFLPTRKEIEDAEPSMLCHGDLHMHNILVDEAGSLTGVVDWECVSALPLWKACDFPRFLRGPIWNLSEPRMELYVPDSFSSDDSLEGHWTFWDDLSQYDRTRLREYFLEEMQRLEPGWVRVFEASERLRNLDLALERLPRYVYGVVQWMDSYVSGDACSLFALLRAH